MSDQIIYLALDLHVNISENRRDLSITHIKSTPQVEYIMQKLNIHILEEKKKGGF